MIGLKAQDTAEVSFDDVRTPAGNLLGPEGEAFGYLGHNLPQGRLSIADSSIAAAHAALNATAEQVHTCTPFGQPISSFQNTRFVLAECATEIKAAQRVI
jgi:acyl-CoA dehydrogenase